MSNDQRDNSSGTLLAFPRLDRTGSFQRYKVNRIRIRQMREAIELSVTELARIAGLEDHFVRDLESGRRDDGQLPNPGHLLCVARALGTDLEELLQDADPNAEESWNASIWSEWRKQPNGPILRALVGARSSMAATSTIESYLVPQEMLGWTESTRLALQNWPQAMIDRWLNYYHDHTRSMRASKEKESNCHVTLIGELSLKPGPARINRLVKSGLRRGRPYP